MKKLFIPGMLIAMLAFVSCSQRPTKELTSASEDGSSKKASVVYVTRQITPSSLVKIYEALGRKAKGRVAVKISTGES